MARTTITRLHTKASQDRSELDRLLDSVHTGHFALVAEDGQPVALPTAVARDGDRMLADAASRPPAASPISRGSTPTRPFGAAARRDKGRVS